MLADDIPSLGGSANDDELVDSFSLVENSGPNDNVLEVIILQQMREILAEDMPRFGAGSANDDELINSFSLLTNSGPDDNASESEPNATVDKISVASHIDTLPNELLGRIFLESCKTGTDNRALEALDMRTFPWVSGQVCRRWRIFALGFPQMWKNLRVTIDQFDFVTRIWCHATQKHISVPKNSPAILQEHLLRCRGISLNVCLEFLVEFVNQEPIIGVEKLFSIVGGHSERWEAARIYLESASLTKSLFDQVSRRLPRLEKLKWTNLPATLPNVVIAPRLAILEVDVLPRTQWFPWSQLTEISLFPTGAEHTLADLRILQTSEKLQRLKFSNSWQRPQHELRFNHLRELHCHLSALDLFLALPALEILHANHHRGETDFTALSAFISRSSPPLQSLSLPYIPTDEDSRVVINALDMLPGLQKFSLCRVFGNPVMAVINHLRVKTFDSATPLPNLQHLDLQCIEAGLIQSACIELIESRFSLDYHVPHLKSVHWLHGFKNKQLEEKQELYNRLVTLEKRRLQVKWGYDM
ncbi:hypothetical protein C8J56DRAFT_948710 [Mycena floridula]|nr:hypothetical protein C8J56DRAFT_948710 [Mycena floridula]